MAVKRQHSIQRAFVGMDDVTIGNRTQGREIHIQNMLPSDRTQPSSLVPRPGLTSMTIASAPEGQTSAVGTFIADASSARLDFAVMGGQIYSSANGSDTLTLVVTTANLTTNSITLAGINEIVYWVEFNGTVVFNDETNQPFAWDGASGAGGLTLLSNAPATCVGKPTVYYAKVFFIKEENVLVWSEENDSNLGYEAGGYNNAWTVGQTSGEDILAIEGTNDALWYWRPHGIGIIAGRVTPDFQTTGVHDAVSSTVGGTKGSVAYYNDRMWWVDSTGRPFMAHVSGGELVPLWKRLRRFFRREAWTDVSGNNPYGLDTATFNYQVATGGTSFVFSVADETEGVVYFFLNGRDSGIAAIFDAESSECLSWLRTQAGTFGCGTMFLEAAPTDGQGSQCLALGGRGSDAGVWKMKLALTGGPVSDTRTDGSERAIVALLVGEPLPEPGVAEYWYDRLDVDVLVPVEDDTDNTVRVSLTTYDSHAPSSLDSPSALTVDLQRVGGGTDVRSLPGRAVFGLDKSGRYLVPKIQIQRVDDDGSLETNLDKVAINSYTLLYGVVSSEVGIA